MRGAGANLVEADQAQLLQVLVILLENALLAVASLASRARRTVKARNDSGPQLLEARNVGGHSWVAYGWDRQP